MYRERGDGRNHVYSTHQKEEEIVFCFTSFSISFFFLLILRRKDFNTSLITGNFRRKYVRKPRLHETCWRSAHVYKVVYYYYYSYYSCTVYVLLNEEEEKKIKEGKF